MRFGEILSKLAPQWTTLAKLIFFSPHPQPDKYRRAIEICAAAMDLTHAELSSMNGVTLCESLFESEQVRLFLMPLAALNLFGDLLEPEQGALSWLWSFLMRACVAPAGNQSLVRALERTYLRNGGSLLRNTVVRELTFDDGECTGAVIGPYNSEETQQVRARHAVVSNLGAALTRSLAGDGVLPPAFDEKLAAWSTDKRVLTIQDFILRRMPPWQAEQRNPDFARSPRIYLVWDSWQGCVDWLQGSYTDEDTFFGDIELTLYYNVYRHDAEQPYALRVRHGTGPYLDDLTDKRKAFTDRLLDTLEPINPGLRREILINQTASAQDFWQANPAARHGNPVGGDFIGGQWLLDRCPYRTAVPRLYMSNSVWPTALSWLAPGYNVAGMIAEDLGVRDQAWWTHEPGEWIERERARLRAQRNAS